MMFQCADHADPVETCEQCQTAQANLRAPNWLRNVTEHIGPLTRDMLRLPKHGDSITADPQPLYRAQYECRHCLERFEIGTLTRHDQIPSPMIDTNLVLHNCTPDIIGVADLQAFVRQ